MSGVVLGVDFGGTKTSVAAWRGAEKVASRRWPTVVAVDEGIDRIIRECVELAAGEPIAMVGVSGGGLVDHESGVLVHVPNLSGWSNVPLVARLEEALGAPVAMENDANASALAEWMYGAGRGVADMAFLTCSTGIGAGLILDGALYRGFRGLAGEVGHMVVEPDGDPCGCGNRGCLEAYASGAGIARRLAARLGDRAGPRTAKDLVDAARTGDPFSLDFLEETARFLGRGLANLVYCIHPRRIVLGTIAVGAGDLLLDPVRRELDRLLWPSLAADLEVLPAGLGAELGDRAARAVAALRGPEAPR